mmetsp:Transcript_21304/g.18454  ORF Transcript_21304/g.18454 Transcript_21304/m.18454 type:complete len:81 (+) Transcript_21304:65-307(+)|eukprot:CAMPEP_0114585502 /NCGR_PEP_ID=MMETSP0125-20121206/9027_1 /TAXON_ID=485358 ORGANISM="Aristerostoma sp., Strain ATCC 50986" /NCGR_SAMPLE_ID=MMETSP0125 /ASSEMBLY_ACC=CAM_ASM_000245 /LENGTH=80 /DNA_ID=CAMNT_0001780607 /DNA_START=61 /DNA_END=303 /DNA_ORIENTATION=+
MSEQPDVLSVLKSEKLKTLLQNKKHLLENLTPRKGNDYLRELRSKFSDSMLDELKKNLLKGAQNGATNDQSSTPNLDSGS